MPAKFQPLRQLPGLNNKEGSVGSMWWEGLQGSWVEPQALQVIAFMPAEHAHPVSAILTACWNVGRRSYMLLAEQSVLLVGALEEAEAL